MIAVDSSSLIAYFSGDVAHDTDRIHPALLTCKLYVCPIVITEVLSGTYDKRIAELLKTLPHLPFLDGFWERAALSRQKLLDRKLKAKIADAIIAQSAIDYNIPLLTRDTDFKHYATLCGLELVE